MLLIILLIFGPKRLPELGNTFGKAIRNFKDSISGVEDAKFRKIPDPQTADSTSKVDSPLLTSQSASVTESQKNFESANLADSAASSDTVSPFSAPPVAPLTSNETTKVSTPTNSPLI